ncbi:MAG: benzoate/H(+) symporter BenE family transporter [Pseudomonadota bacterium]
MPLSLIASAFVAAIVGYGSTIALVLAAAQALQATAAETASWVAAVCLAKAIGSALLSTWTRVPVVLAWSTPGAALIAGTSGIAMPEAVGAFVLAGALIFATAAIPLLGRLIAAIPAGIAAAMLAGVLLPFALEVAKSASNQAALVWPIIAAFVAVRIASPLYAVIAALVVGVGLVAADQGLAADLSAFTLQPLAFIAPTFDPGVLLGLGVPLFLVTMASQNLPGFAVLRAHGYAPPVERTLAVTGLGSSLAALAGAHTFNMAAITAAICLSDDVHANRTKRWRVGLAYAAFWIVLAFAGPVLIAIILAMPQAVVATIAGLALITPLSGALSEAFADTTHRFPAVVTFFVTASGITAIGVGAAFWGLLAGLILIGLDRIVARRNPAEHSKRPVSRAKP